MIETTLTSEAQSIDDTVAVNDNNPTMIKVDHISMEFNMASEQLNSLKEYAIALLKRNLYFEKFTALDDISFNVKKGDVFGILGTNGSGKSTLLKIIAGVLNPTKGSCVINGSIAPLIELGAGFDMELSARENIYLNGSLLGYSKKFIDENFDAIVEFAEVEKFLDMPMKNYSSGMVARIAFAIATVIVPEILIVDEVLSVGDFLFQQKCENRINDLIENYGVTVLIVSHSNEQIERLCNKAIWIEKGHARAIGDASKVCNTYKVLSVGRDCNDRSYVDISESLNSMQSLSEIKINYGCLKNKLPANTWFDIVKNYWAGETNKVVISGIEKFDAILASNLAGALKCPVLTYSIASVNNLYNYLIQEKPKEIFIVDSIFEIQSNLNMNTLDWPVSIKCFKSENPTELSCIIYEYMSDLNIGFDTVYIADTENSASLLTVSSMFYNNPGFVFLQSPDFEVDELLFRALLENDISRIWSIPPIDSFKSSIMNDEIQLIDFSNLNCCPYNKISEMSFMENAYVREACNHGNKKPVPLFLSPYSVCQWNEIPLIGYYSGVTGSSFFLVDYTNLNCLAEILSFIRLNADNIEELVYVGSSTELNGVYNQLFLSELAAYKKEKND